MDENGVVRVAGTRVTLDTLIAAFNTGATSEEIAQPATSRRGRGISSPET
jgi:hypothetical protein